MEEYRKITVREHLTLNLPLQLGLLTIAAMVWFLVWLHVGKAGECKPHSLGAACGESSMVGFFYGLGGAFVIFIGGGITALLAYIKRIPPKQ